ncbi:MAG TPA: tetratricopeptide repeat protein [Kofleriaceae bacterium]|nr:tetratricopeptide repeat protein [Kofleriaceae bacterium]
MNDVAKLRAFLIEQPDVQRLGRVLQLAEGFELEIVICPSPVYANVLTELLARDLTSAERASRRLVVRSAGRGTPITEHDITRDLLDRLAEPAAREVVWLDLSFAQPDEVTAWRWLFHRLNERRNGLAEALAAPLVLLLPRWLEPVLPAEAPDLWSGRSLTVDLARQPTAPLQIDPSELVSRSGSESLSALRGQARTRAATVERSLEDRRAYASALRRFTTHALDHVPLPEVRRYVDADLVPLSETLDDPIEHARALRAQAAVRLREGEKEAALAILTGQVLPLLRDRARSSSDEMTAREIAETEQQIALVLEAQDRPGEAMRILQQDVLPRQKRMADVRGEAATLGQMANLLLRQGRLEEALDVLRARLLPLYEGPGHALSRAHTLGRIAAIHRARGDLDQAKQLYCDELAVYERQGDRRAVALTMSELADVAQARGELDDAERIRRVEVLPVLEPLGGFELYNEWIKLGRLLIERGAGDDLATASEYLQRAAAMAAALQLPFPDALRPFLPVDPPPPA